MEIEIKPQDLQLTKSAYMSLIRKSYKQGKSLRQAFYEVESSLEKFGHAGRFTSFESFKAVFSREKNN